MLEVLSFLDGAVPLTPASSTLLSRKPAQRSARDSRPEAEVGSAKNSWFKAGELGVRWKGDAGRRSV
jgi:hypothetical protein